MINRRTRSFIIAGLAALPIMVGVYLRQIDSQSATSQPDSYLIETVSVDANYLKFENADALDTARTDDLTLEIIEPLALIHNAGDTIKYTHGNYNELQKGGFEKVRVKPVSPSPTHTTSAAPHTSSGTRPPCS